MEYCIYIIHFPKPNKVYVGLSSDYELRKSLHYSDMKKGGTQLVHRAMKKHAHEFGILESGLTLDEAKSLEQEYIAAFGSFECRTNGYNLTKGGEGVFGYKHTEETKQLLREKRLNQKNVGSVPKGYIPWNKGLKGTQEAWNKGKKMSESHRLACSKAHKGRVPVNRRRIIVDNREYKSVREAYTKLGVCKKTMYNWIDKGKAVYA